MARLTAGLTLIAMFALSSSVALQAQRGGGGGRGGGSGGRGSGFQVGVNLPATPIPPPAGMSISRPIGTEITGVQTNPPPGFGPTPRSPFAARPGTYTRLHRISPFGYGVPYGSGYDFPYYGFSSYVPESTYDKLYRTPEPPITEGTLLLDVTPLTASVFIDSAFVGNVQDLQTRGATLSSGRHWVDLEAADYDRKTIEVTIRAGEPLRYRFDMTPTRRAEVIAAPPRPPQTLYMIAGCYAGNRPPVAANLPTGCDVKNVRVIRPQGAVVR